MSNAFYDGEARAEQVIADEGVASAQSLAASMPEGPYYAGFRAAVDSASQS